MAALPSLQNSGIKSNRCRVRQGCSRDVRVRHRDVQKNVSISRPRLHPYSVAVLMCSWRNNRVDRETGPQLLGWGDQQCIGPPTFIYTRPREPTN